MTSPHPFSLTEATDAEKRERDAVCFAEWGTRLSPAQFAEREQALRAHRWSRAAMQTWLLRDATGRVLSSCETFQTPCRFEGTWGEAWQIASVFTEEHLRGQRHATRMLSLLADLLAARHGRPTALTLYSDVGAPIYERCGFHAVPTPHDWILSPLAGDPHEGVDALITEDRLALEHAAIPLPDSALLLWPTSDEIDWHLERERLYARLLDQPRPIACGAQAGDVRALWATSSRGGSLEVLLLGDGAPESQRAVLNAARRVAAHAGLSQVRLWEDPQPDVVSPAQSMGATRTARDGSLPMLRPLAPGVTVEGWQRLPRGLWV